MKANGKVQENIRDYEYIDLTFLHAMADGNFDFIVEMLQTFNDEAGELINGVKESMEENDLDKLKFFVHKFKSSISLVGNKELQNLLNEIEQNIKTAVNLDAVPSMVDKALQLSTGVLNEVSEELKSLH